MADRERSGVESAPSWRGTSWAQSDLTVRAPRRSRLRWPIIFGAAGAVVAVVLIGLVFLFARQAHENKQVRYDVQDIGNTQAGHPHTGPLLGFLPPSLGGSVIGEQSAMAKGDLAPVHFGADEQINPWQTIVRGAYRAVVIPDSGNYELRLFQFRDAAAAERYASIIVGNWRTGPFSIGADGPVLIPNVPNAYALADGPRPDNSTNVYAIAVRGDVVVSILGTQSTDKTLLAVDQYISEVYALL